MCYKTILFLDDSKSANFLLNQIKKNKKFNLLCIIKNKNFKLPKKNLNQKISVFCSSLKSKNSKIINFLIQNKIDIGFSYYNYKIPEIIFKKLKIGVINFHPSYLPYNRGRHSAFWSIYNNTPKGATSHWINNKYDDGDIFLRKKIREKKFLTAQEVYERQIDVLKIVMVKTLSLVSKNILLKKKQAKIKDYHFAKNLIKKINIESNQKMWNFNLIKIILATKFDNHGFFLKLKKKKYKIINEIGFRKTNRKVKNYKILVSKLFKNIDNKRKSIIKIYYQNYYFKIKSKIVLQIE